MPISNESTKTLKSRLKDLKARRLFLTNKINHGKAILKPLEAELDQINTDIAGIKQDVQDD